VGERHGGQPDKPNPGQALVRGGAKSKTPRVRDAISVQPLCQSKRKGAHQKEKVFEVPKTVSGYAVYFSLQAVQAQHRQSLERVISDYHPSSQHRGFGL